MKTVATKIRAAFLLIVFLFGTMPPEYLHDVFANHTDGVDPIPKKGQVLLTKAHHHCAFLNFTCDPFVSAQQKQISFTQTVASYGWVIPIYSEHFSTDGKVISLRGPPCGLSYLS